MLRRDVFADHYVYTPERDLGHTQMGEFKMHLNETREVKATLTADTGRVLAWSTDKEPRHISIAVPGDRAKLTPVQARELADWLIARAVEVASATPAQRMRDRYTMG